MNIYPPAVPPTRAWSEAGWLPMNGAAHENLGTYGTVGLSAINMAAVISTIVPHDFVALTEAILLVIPRVTLAAAQYSIYSNYGSPGQAYDIHTENDTISTYNVTINVLFEIDIRGILTNIVAGDAIGIDLFQRDALSEVNAVLVRFRYD